MNTFNYKRRATVSVPVGGIAMGSEWPVRVQSMTNTSTDDIEGSAAQCQRIAYAGASYVRLTASTMTTTFDAFIEMTTSRNCS